LALSKSQEAMRASFETNRHEQNEDAVRTLLRGVGEADEMLRFHILQGKRNERGNYGEMIPMVYVLSPCPSNIFRFRCSNQRREGKANG
jgi:hypothetical protein